MTRAMRTWDPLRDLGMFRDDWMPRLTSSGLLKEGWNPSCDIVKTDDEFIVQAELPGVAREDIDVAVDGDVLRIKGEKTVTAEGDDDGMTHRERFYGRFARTFTLSETVDADKITAELKDGVLVVKLPRTKAEEPKMRTVKIGKG